MGGAGSAGGATGSPIVDLANAGDTVGAGGVESAIGSGAGGADGRAVGAGASGARGSSGASAGDGGEDSATAARKGPQKRVSSTVGSSPRSASGAAGLIRTVGSSEPAGLERSGRISAVGSS